MLLCSGFQSLEKAFASDQTPSTESVPSINAWIEGGKVFDNGTWLHPVLRLRTEDRVFGFALVDGYRVNASNPRNITITEGNYNYFLNLRVIPSSSSPEERIQTVFPDAEVTQRTTIASMGRNRPVLIAAWKPENCPLRQVIITHISTSAGVLEVTLTSRPETFSEGQNLFNDFLSRAKSSEQGSTRFVPLKVPTHS